MENVREAKLEHDFSMHTITIVSGGTGTSGEQLVNTVLAQFSGDRVRVITAPNIRYQEQVDELVGRARAEGATLVHTMVDASLRCYLVAKAAEQGVAAIDLMGPLMERLREALGREPLGQPGLYRKLNKAYFERVAAIEYTMAHDDGKNPEDWLQAEIFLVGVSRVGKTPLSLYLSVLGWKVANLPLVPGLESSTILLTLDRQRVFGLTISPGQLVLLRQQRQRRLGAPGTSDYTDPQNILAELEYAEEIFRRGGFTVIEVTDKPLESTADEIIRLISTRFGVKDRPG
jgi:hypothetical protein